ncbi:hypothetical protein [Microbacterium hydrocarbonoxydans]|uniref:hypothetical protein n=1 Tax=Microbacterium hydrocarbonoxydans TaxID=273678 RepID=UPI003D99BCE5
MAEVEALQEAGYQVGVWRPEGERSENTTFWGSNRLTVYRGSLRRTVEMQQHHAAFVLTPSNKHKSLPAYRERMTTGGLLNFPPRAVNAAVGMLRGDFYA